MQFESLLALLLVRPQQSLLQFSHRSPQRPHQPQQLRAMRLQQRLGCSIGDVVESVELRCLAILSTPGQGGKNGGKIQDIVGNCLVQRFGRFVRTNRGVSARECAEALGKASASPY